MKTKEQILREQLDNMRISQETSKLITYLMLAARLALMGDNLRIKIALQLLRPFRSKIKRVLCNYILALKNQIEESRGVNEVIAAALIEAQDLHLLAPYMDVEMDLEVRMIVLLGTLNETLKTVMLNEEVVSILRKHVQTNCIPQGDLIRVLKDSRIIG